MEEPANHCTDLSPRLVRLAGWTAIAAALVGMAADLCLLYAPRGGYGEGDYRFMAGTSERRLLWGHYLGVLAIPWQAAGLVLIYGGLRPVGRLVSTGAVVLGVYVTFIGVAYHAALYPMAGAARRGGDAVERLRPFHEPLGLGFAALFLLLMGLLAVLILRGGTRFPRWLVLVSPLLTYPVSIAAYLTVPAVGNYLAPMGFNLSMAIFYAAIVASGCLTRAETAVG